MSDIYVGGRSSDMAVLLLAAAADLGLDASVVRTTSKGYLAPEEVVEQANASDEIPEPVDEKPVAKKAVAKKATAKKTTAKKAASNKPQGEE